MRNREDRRRKLGLKRERLQQLTELGRRDMEQVAGGDLFGCYPDGRIGSRCCH